MSPQVAGALGRGGGGEGGQAWATCSLELVPEVARGRVGEAGVVRLVQVCARCPIEGRGTAGTSQRPRRPAGCIGSTCDSHRQRLGNFMLPSSRSPTQTVLGI